MGMTHHGSTDLGDITQGIKDRSLEHMQPIVNYERKLNRLQAYLEDAFLKYVNKQLPDEPKVKNVTHLRELFINPQYLGEWIDSEHFEKSAFTLSFMIDNGVLRLGVANDGLGIAIIRQDPKNPEGNNVFLKQYVMKDFGENEINSPFRYTFENRNGLFVGRYQDTDGSGEGDFKFERYDGKNTQLQPFLEDLYFRNLKKL